MTDWTSLSYVVVDVEGNGQQPPDLVELAAVPIVGGIIGEPVSWLVKPDQPITYFARKIHGITNEQVADAPVFGYVEADVLKALDASALIAHNAHVDVGVLQRKLGDSPVTSSVRSSTPSTWPRVWAPSSSRTAPPTTCW